MTDSEYLDIAKSRIVKMFADAKAVLPEEMFERPSTLYISHDGSSVHSWLTYTLLESLFGKGSHKALKEKLLDYQCVRITSKGFFITLSKTELEIEAAKSTEGDKSAVLEKVAKLLALADTERNDSESEAIAASIAAQKLLAKHNLTMADLGGDREESIEKVCADVEGKKFKWSLAGVIAESYCCKCYAVGHTGIVFYGYKSDALIARRVFLYLTGVCDRLARRRAAQYRKRIGYADGVYNSFAKGFVAGVHKELKKTCTALALIVPPAVEESYEELSKSFNGKGIDGELKAYDADSYYEGVAEGRNALNAQYISSERQEETEETAPLMIGVN